MAVDGEEWQESVEEASELEQQILPPPLPSQAYLPVERKSVWGGGMTLLWGLIIAMVWQGSAGVIGLVLFFVSDEFEAKLLSGKEADVLLFEERFMSFFMGGDILFYSMVPATIFCCFLCWLFGKIRHGFSGGEYLGLVKFRWWQAGFFLLLFLGLIVGLEGISIFSGDKPVHESQLTMVKGSSHWLFVFVAVVVCASFGEEFLFRGFLYTGWRETWLGRKGAAVLTSFLWTIIHVQYGVQILVFLFFFGLMLAWARERSGSLWVPIGLHFINNALSLWQTYAYLERAV